MDIARKQASMDNLTAVTEDFASMRVGRITYQKYIKPKYDSDPVFRAQLQARSREWFRAHYDEECKEKKKAYYEENKDRIKAQSKARYAALVAAKKMVEKMEKGNVPSA